MNLARPNPRLIIGLAAALLAFAVSGALVSLMGLAPTEAYSSMLDGALGDSQSISATLTQAVPIAVAALAFTVAFTGGLFNLGIEGQLLWGAVAAAVVGSHVDVPVVGIVAALVAAAVVGGLWAVIPIVLRLRRGVSEIVTSLFLNYVALFTVAWLLTGPLKAPDATIAQTELINESARLPALLPDIGLTWAAVIVVALAVGVWLLITRMRFGFELRTIGASNDVARYVGIRVERSLFTAFVASGALGGIVGALEVLGNQYAVSTGFSGGWGYTGIAAALLGAATAAGSVLGGVFFGVLASGGQQMQFDLGVPSSFIQVAQAVALVAVLIGTVFGDRLLGGQWRRRKRPRPSADAPSHDLTAEEVA